MEELFAALRAAGVGAVHLVPLRKNVAARAFYDKLGFHEIDVPGQDAVWFLGRSTAPFTS